MIYKLLEVWILQANIGIHKGKYKVEIKAVEPRYLCIKDQDFSFSFLLCIICSALILSECKKGEMMLTSIYICAPTLLLKTKYEMLLVTALQWKYDCY